MLAILLMNGNEMADQMTEKQWRCILWRHKMGYDIAAVAQCSTYIATVITFCLVFDGIVPRIVPIVCLLTCLASTCLVIKWGNDNVPEYQSALLAKQQHAAKIEKRERERMAREQEAMREIIAETGYGLGNALWKDVGAIKDASRRLSTLL